jgi:hypothetical protein
LLARTLVAGIVGLLCLASTLLVTAAADPPRLAASPAPPGRVELVGHSPLLNRGMNAALAVHGDYAYIGSRTDGTHPNAGVLVVDVSDPAGPEVTGQIAPPDEANPAETSRELRVWPEQDLLMVMNFQCDVVGHACFGAAAGSIEPTFRFYDIAGKNAAAPRLVATYRLSRNPHEFFLWRDPGRPGRALLYITTPFVEGADIDREGTHLLVTDVSRARQGEFRELVKWSPRREGRWDEAALHSLSVSRDGGRAYLADLEGGFAVADTSDLARDVPGPEIRQLTPPERTVHHESPGAHSALPVPGRPYALITDEVYGAAFGAGPLIGFNVLKGCPWGWARTIDVRDPARPREVGEYKVLPWNDPERCSSVTPTQQHGASFSSHNPTLAGRLALITWHSAGLQVASLADPERPGQLAEYKPDPLPAVLAEDPALSAGTEKTVMWSYPVVKDGLVYVVDVRNGLYVLRYSGPYEDDVRCLAFLEGNSNVARRRPRCRGAAG